MRISDWSSDVCSSDLLLLDQLEQGAGGRERLDRLVADHVDGAIGAHRQAVAQVRLGVGGGDRGDHDLGGDALVAQAQGLFERDLVKGRSEEHTSELQSLMRISYAVFCLKKKK